MLPSCDMKLTAAVVSRRGQSSPGSAPVPTLPMPRNAPADTALLRAHSITPEVPFEGNWTAQQTFYPLQQTGTFTHFFPDCCLPLYQQLVHMRHMSLCLWSILLCRVLLKQWALLAFRMFDISRVAQTGLCRAWDMSHHLKLHLWVFFGLFVKVGDNIFAYWF